jgi:diacylglycerol kinase (ATP)
MLKDGARLRAAAIDIGKELYGEASEPAQIAVELERLARGKPELLAVIGGDGTVHAVLSHLYGAGRFRPHPPIALIPAGSTNMTAYDFGIRGRPGRALERLRKSLGSGQPAAVELRRPLQIEHGGMDAMHGMFFGAGVISAGVRYFTEHVRRPGVTGESASLTVIIRYLAALLTGRAGDSVAAEIREDGIDAGAGTFSAVLASSLHRLLLGMRPYWGTESAPVHFTAVRQSPRALWRKLPELLAGRGAGLQAADGYHSRNLSALEIRMDGDFVVDGQIYRARRRNGPVRIRAAEPAAFLRI